MERSIRKWVLWISFYNIKFKSIYLTHAGYRRYKVRYPVGFKTVPLGRMEAVQGTEKGAIRAGNVDLLCIAVSP